MKFRIPLLTPLKTIPGATWTVVALVEAGLALLAWQASGGGLIPGPLRVAQALGAIVTNPDFVFNLVTSITLTVKAMFVSIVIALLITYLSVLPIFRPIAGFIVQCRYLTLTGLIFLFTLLTKDGSALKTDLLIFGIVPFFVTSLMSVLASIDEQEYDLCRTLRMGRWETVWEVIILGRIDSVFDVMRQNFAISWLMITMVEGLSMSEGGLGVMLIKANKYINLPGVFGILVLIFTMGLGFDALLKNTRLWLFPYVRGAK